MPLWEWFIRSFGFVFHGVLAFSPLFLVLQDSGKTIIGLCLIAWAAFFWAQWVREDYERSVVQPRFGRLWRDRGRGINRSL